MDNYSAVNNTNNHYSAKQEGLPLFISNILEICNPMYVFDKDSLIQLYG